MKWCKSTAAHSSALMHHMASFNNHSEKQGGYKRATLSVKSKKNPKNSQSLLFLRDDRSPKNLLPRQVNKFFGDRCFIALALKTAHLIPKTLKSKLVSLCLLCFMSTFQYKHYNAQEVGFASVLPGQFTEVALVNPPDKKMVNPTSAM